MKIAILGGTFNPPHLGHLLIIQQILNFEPIDQVWLTPCWQHTFKKNLSSAKHRANMTKMLIKDKRVKYCQSEIKNRLSGETIELLKLLSQKYKQHQFSFIIGSDNLNDFKKWSQWQQLVTKYQLLVFPRPEFKYSLEKYGLAKQKYNIRLINHPLLVTLNISSSIIRQRIKKGFSAKHLCSNRVLKYIQDNKLYQD